jgi:hypothetical protein
MAPVKSKTAHGLRPRAPRHCYRGRAVRLQLADVDLQRDVGHPIPSFGYSDSLDKKKRYAQSILQVDPTGLASRPLPVLIVSAATD